MPTNVKDRIGGRLTIEDVRTVMAGIAMVWPPTWLGMFGWQKRWDSDGLKGLTLGKVR